MCERMGVCVDNLAPVQWAWCAAAGATDLSGLRGGLARCDLRCARLGAVEHENIDELHDMRAENRLHLVDIASTWVRHRVHIGPGSAVLGLRCVALHLISCVCAVLCAFRVQDSGFRVQGPKFRVEGLGFRV